MMRLHLFVALFSALSCSGQTPTQKLKAPIKPVKNNLVQTEIIKFQGTEIRITTPPDSVKINGDLLLLPGWNYSNTLWCDSTDICAIALSQGFRVVAPQMGKSIYATHYFPETRADYRKYPTLAWLDSALEHLKSSKGMFTGKEHRNFVMGLSTGARGAALICARKPGFFHAAALLSGDYDQSAMTDDPLCTNVYGSYQQFSERWKTVDNPMQQIGKIITPMYIGHGGMDKVIHVTQSINYYDSLMAYRKNDIMQQNSKYVVQRLVKEQGSQATAFGLRLDPVDFLELNISAPAGHNWDYWRSEIPNIWTFFNRR